MHAAATVLQESYDHVKAARDFAAEGLTQLSQGYSQQLEESLDGAGFSIIPLDVHTVVSEVLADPEAYGFDNAIAPACNTSTVDDSQRYFFADQVHPTPEAHAILAQYAASVVDAPQLISELPYTVARDGLSQARSLDRHMRLARHDGEANTFNIFASGGYTSLKLGADPAVPHAHGDNVDFTIGADWHVTDNILLGAAFGHSRLDSRFGEDSGYFTVYDNLFMLYASGEFDNAYVNATTGYGLLDFSDIGRNIALGTASRHEKGHAHGDQLLLRLSGGYDFYWNALTTGPTVALTYQRVHVNSYREQGDRSTSMHFGSQNLNSLMGSLGWRVDYDVGKTFAGRLRPYASATYLHEFRKNEDRVVRAGLNTFGPDFTMPAYQPDRDYANISIGLDDEVGRGTTVSVNLSTTLGQRNGHEDAVAMTLSRRF